MEKLKHIFSGVLLIALSISFIPLESLHHHEGEQLICNNTDTHFDEHAIACDLCDFMLQEYLSQQSIIYSILQFQYSELLEIAVVDRTTETYQVLHPRGPPNKA